MTTNIIEALYYLFKTHISNKKLIKIFSLFNIISYILTIGNQ